MPWVVALDDRQRLVFRERGQALAASLLQHLDAVEFCFRTGLNYVSCSPFRVPIARLAAAQAAEAGVVIRTATVDGYRLTYRLLDWKERNAAMKGMEGMEMAGMDNSGKSTHHLVLHLTGPGGNEVSGSARGGSESKDGEPPVNG